MALKVYFDYLSQPSRALLIFLQSCNIPYEKFPVALKKGEHLTDKFKNEVSRFQKVPIIMQNDFKLTESVAIVRYLSREFNIDNSWYPKDSKAQARIDEYLEWQHISLRIPCSAYFLSRLMGRDFTKAEKKMEEAVNDFERLWLSESPYIYGNKISIADIFAACELEQPRFYGYDAANGRPVLSKWWTNVQSAPYYEEIHSLFNKLASKMVAKL